VEQREVVDFMRNHMTRRVLPLLLVFAFTGALPGQVPSKARIDSLLQAASNALAHYQTLAPSIRSNHANEKMLRDSCNGALEMLGRDVQDAKKNIARYRALAAPQSVDLFDILRNLPEDHGRNQRSRVRGRSLR
jgi:hypothetical protein